MSDYIDFPDDLAEAPTLATGCLMSFLFAIGAWPRRFDVTYEAIDEFVERHAV